MKIALKLITLLLVISCKAQTVVPLFTENIPDNVRDFKPLYYKDIDNDLDPYVGTWQGTLNNGTLKITFNKVVRVDAGLSNFTDMLVGEYEYKENGTVLVNTYPQLLEFTNNNIPNIVHPEDPWENNIGSISIVIGYNVPPCTECPANTRYVRLGLFDPTRPNVSGEIVMAHFIDNNGIDKIRMRIYATSFDDINRLLTIPENSIWTLTKVD